jgi:predicted  nucleic acid-binding Zn-ribbon protein
VGKKKSDHHLNGTKRVMKAISNIEAEIEKTKESVMKLKRECEVGETKVTFTKMRNLQKQIDAYDKRYNDTLGEIERVKAEITALRQARLLYKDNLTSVEEDIAHAEQQLEGIFQEIEQEQNHSKTSQNAMLELKMQS